MKRVLGHQLVKDGNLLALNENEKKEVMLKKKGNTVMILGIGDLGGWALEFLARCEGVSRIITADIREDYGALKTESAAVGAGHQGYSKTIEFHKCDVNDIDATADLIRATDPDVIYSVVSLKGCGSLKFLPPDIVKKNWQMLPIIGTLQLPLVAKVMEAVKKSGIDVAVVNGSWADVINSVLWRHGLGPLVGAGTQDTIVAEIQRKISVARNIPMHDVTVYLIAQHAVGSLGTRAGVPYFLKVMIGDKDITGELDVDSMISDRLVEGAAILRPEWFPWCNQPQAAAAAVRNIMAIINDANLFTHSPGPNGLLGTYPIRLSAKGVEVVLPEEVTLEQAIKINTDALKFEGIEEVKEDGALIFTEKVCEMIKETYGLEYKELRLADAAYWAEEILSAFKRLSS